MNLQEINEADGIASVHEAFRLGINFFDTSPFYGTTKSEQVRRVGQLFPGSCCNDAVQHTPQPCGAAFAAASARLIAWQHFSSVQQRHFRVVP